MCVIATKQKGVKISLKTMEDMFEANPHGAGFAIVEKGITEISKGYFSVQDMFNDVNNLQDESLVLHFRIATHGELSSEMTHPFIVDKNVKNSTKIMHVTEKPVLFHNGIIQGYGDKEVSDTCDFVTGTLAHLDTLEKMTRVLSLVGGSKFVLINKGKIYRIGNFEKYKGLYVSNDYFIKEYTHEVKLSKRKISDNDYGWSEYDTLLAESGYCHEKERDMLDSGGYFKTSIKNTSKTISKKY